MCKSSLSPFFSSVISPSLRRGASGFLVRVGSEPARPASPLILGNQINRTTTAREWQLPLPRRFPGHWIISKSSEVKYISNAMRNKWKYSTLFPYEQNSGAMGGGSLTLSTKAKEKGKNSEMSFGVVSKYEYWNRLRGGEERILSRETFFL